MASLDAFFHEVFQLSSKELLSRFRGEFNTREKPDSSFVTDADIAAEKAIISKIKQHFPDDSIIAEESGFSTASKEPGTYAWVIDPLDGTTNFANGYPFFSTSIARCRYRDDNTLESVNAGIHDPTRGVTYLATKGEGATKNGKKMAVQTPRPFEKSFLVTGFYYTKGDALDAEVARFRKVAQVCQSIRRDGSAALDLAFVAEGIFDCFWERGLALWDVAAGALLVHEAGGHVSNYPSSAKKTGFEGACQLFRLEGDGIIAGNSSGSKAIFDLI